MLFSLIIKESLYIQYTYNEIIMDYVCDVSQTATVFSFLSNYQLHPGIMLIKI